MGGSRTQIESSPFFTVSYTQQLTLEKIWVISCRLKVYAGLETAVSETFIGMVWQSLPLCQAACYSSENSDSPLKMMVERLLSFSNGLFSEDIPSWELTYPWKVHFEDDFPFPQVGYANFLEGINFMRGVIPFMTVHLGRKCLQMIFGGLWGSPSQKLAKKTVFLKGAVFGK